MSFSLFAEMYRNMTERTEERTWRALIQKPTAWNCFLFPEMLQ